MRASLKSVMRTGKKVSKPFRRVRVRKTSRIVPQICPKHGVEMVVRRTTPDVRYHYCPHPDCRESKVTVR